MLKRICRMVACRNEYVTSWKIQPCRTNEGTKDKISEKVSPNAGVTALRTVVSRNIPALTRTSHFTALVKGGRLNENVRPRYIGFGYSRQARENLSPKLFYILAGSTLGRGHDGEAPVPGLIQRLHCKNNVVLRYRHGGFQNFAYTLRAFPIWSSGRAP